MKTAELKKLREAFSENQISKKPAQAGWMKDKKNEYVNCNICGGWHHPKANHLDYVGHAALTDRLLDVDPEWNWEPLSFTEHGQPVYDQFGGMWIKLTICGVTRLGYGHADGKKGGDAIKEVIGDALRNSAMRFGAALDLWHKGDLHIDEHEEQSAPKKQPPTKKKPAPTTKIPPKAPKPTMDVPSWIELIQGALAENELKGLFGKAWEEHKGNDEAHAQLKAAYDLRKEQMNKQEAA